MADHSNAYFEQLEWINNSSLSTEPMYCPAEVLERGKQVDDWISYREKPTDPIAIKACIAFDNSDIGRIINAARHEIKFQHEFYRYLDIGNGYQVKAKCKPDIYIKGRSNYDIKTTSCKTPYQYESQGWPKKYQRPMGLYSRMCRTENNALIVISTTTFKVWTRPYTQAELEAGYQDFINEVRKLFGYEELTHSH